MKVHENVSVLFGDAALRRPYKGGVACAKMGGGE